MLRQLRFLWQDFELIDLERRKGHVEEVDLHRLVALLAVCKSENKIKGTDQF